MTATADPALDQVQRLNVKRLEPHPMNPRVAGKSKALDELVESMRALGQLEPLLVRRVGESRERWEILSGHRRAEALEVLEIETALCIVREPCSDAEALGVLLTTNEQREDVDPFREAKAVKALVDVEGSVRTAAKRLGQSVTWVAQRVALLDLSPGWAQRRKKEPWSKWSPAHWALLSKLSTDAQEALLKDNTGETWHLEDENLDLSDLERIVAERLRIIGKAPFDVADPKLVKGRPACGDCPETSQSAPGLFDDGQPQNLETATCRNTYCWARKAAAGVQQAIDVLRKKVATGPATDVPVVAQGYNHPAVIGKVLTASQWAPAKEGEKGAVPVVILDQKGQPKAGFATLAGSGSGSSKKKSKASSGSYSSAPPKSMTVQQRVDFLEEQHREACELARRQLIETAIDKVGAVGFPQALALLLLVGAEPHAHDMRKQKKAFFADRLALASCLAAAKTVKVAEEDQFVRASKEAIASALEFSLEGLHNVRENVDETYEARLYDVIAIACGLTTTDLQSVVDKEKPSKALLLAREALANEKQKWEGQEIGGKKPTSKVNLATGPKPKKAGGGLDGMLAQHEKDHAAALDVKPKKGKVAKAAKASKPAKKKKAAKS